MKSGGGARTLVDFLDTLASAREAEDVRVFISPSSRCAFDVPVRPGWVIEQRTAEDESLGRRLWWYLAGLGRRCAQIDARVLLALNGMGSFKGRPVIGFVMQSLPYWPEALGRLPVAARIRMATIGSLTRRCCRRAEAVYTQSPWMIDLLSDQFGLGRDTFRIAPPGTAPFPQGDAPGVMAQLAAVPFESRVLFVGGDAPHKNLNVLVAGIQQVRAQLPTVTLFATIGAGNRLATSEGVVSLGELDRRALRVAYENCAVTVQAALVECAGLVPAEAMRCGCPVIVPDRPWAREMCGSRALYFNPNDSSTFAEQLLRILTDPSLRSAMADAARCVSGGNASDGYHELVGHLIALASGGER